MSCYKCACLFCARNVELELQYFTPGEISGVEVCFDCDECRHYSGDRSQTSKWKPDCLEFIEARKHAELAAAAMRRKLKIIK